MGFTCEVIHGVAAGRDGKLGGRRRIGESWRTTDQGT
jgi:hypothetical protein